MSAHRGIFLAPFDDASDPRLIAELAAEAEQAGWDGFFLWDHLKYSNIRGEVSDPWVVLSAIAMTTERIRIGPLVTPLSRRRIHKLARETVTLDRLSNGRLILGVGLGSDNHGELQLPGEVRDPKERAQLLDAGLEQLAAYWEGEFIPPPVQQPRIPIWVAGRYPAKPPIRRAARWDGYFPIEYPGPDELRDIAGQLPDTRPFDLVVTLDTDEDIQPWVDAGATWVLRGFGKSPDLDEVRAAVRTSPAAGTGRA
ncbi:MAG: LLM class flavin-dependent oxidoreductase [Solirubrobacteraceae bacterium]|nr:LLM class flavin-dependent oxidoreductase [Solirubrobacteraceae bacterium]